MNNNYPTIIEIRPGNGGTDAQKFTTQLANQIIKALTRAGHKTNPQPMSNLNRSLTIHTTATTQQLQTLTGNHTIQRIPKNSTRRHTSSSTIIVRDNIPLPTGTLINPDHIHIERYRGSGPGGQHRNKVSTAIRLTHTPTNTVITRESGRSQTQNLNSALTQLEDTLKTLNQNKIRHNINQTRQQSLTPTKTFTHNEQRNQTIHHPTNTKYSLEDWAQHFIN